MRIGKYWYSWNWFSILALPLSLLFGLVSNLRRLFYQLGILRIQQCDVPIIVVGNIMVGGVGKTPLVIWLAEELKRKGFTPGIVSRGYGGSSQSWPQQVRPDSDAAVVGDEPILLACRTECPVCVGPDRVAAVEALLEYTSCDIIISDDGLQHYALGRDLEIIVMDGERRFGNGFWLPTGPLRERAGRLKTADMVITNGGQPLAGAFNMKIHNPLIHLISDKKVMTTFSEFQNKSVHAIAAIGYPERFFKSLRKQAIMVIAHPFPDHYSFKESDLEFNDDIPILMTEKDAVKCVRMGFDHIWVVSIDAEPDKAFKFRFNKLLEENEIEPSLKLTE